MKGISVIVPIYNVEAYIDACIQSLQKSMKGHTNVEILFINDGSPDRSGEIAKSYCEDEPRFRYIEQMNRGLSNARNVGVKYSRYPYIAFVDSDDQVAPHYFQTLLALIETQCDLYIFDAELIRQDTTEVLEGIDVANELWTMQSNAGFKLYKRHLLDLVPFTEGIIYEDVCFTYKLPFYVKSYQYTNEALYLYRLGREGSILNTPSEKINDIFKVFQEIFQFYEDRQAFNEEVNRGLAYQLARQVLWSNTYRQLKFNRYHLFRYYSKIKQSRELLQNNFPNWQQNDLIHKNEPSFKSRFGNHYLKRMDALGKTFLLTSWATLQIVWINRKRT